MIGVILGADRNLRQAMIWCEDHGDLAYYRWTADEAPLALTKGDCVSFSITIEGSLRIASNLERLGTEQSNDLSAQLAWGRRLDASHPAQEADFRVPGPIDLTSANSGTVMTWAEAREDPLFIDMPSFGDPDAPAVALDGAEEMGNVISFPDQAERAARQARRA